MTGKEGTQFSFSFLKRPFCKREWLQQGIFARLQSWLCEQTCLGVEVLNFVKSYFTEAMIFGINDVTLKSQEYNGRMTWKSTNCAKCATLQMKFECSSSRNLSAFFWSYSIEACADNNDIHKVSAVRLFSQFKKKLTKATLLHFMSSTMAISAQNGETSTQV